MDFWPIVPGRKAADELVAPLHVALVESVATWPGDEASAMEIVRRNAGASSLRFDHAAGILAHPFDVVSMPTFFTKLRPTDDVKFFGFWEVVKEHTTYAMAWHTDDEWGHVVRTRTHLDVQRGNLKIRLRSEIRRTWRASTGIRHDLRFHLAQERPEAILDIETKLMDVRPEERVVKALMLGMLIIPVRK